MIRVLLIDDHAIVREGFKRLIESSPGFLVVAEARNADEALSALERVSADIAVVDISLGDGASSGLDLIALLRDLMHGLRCVVLSMHDDSGLVLRALEQGARGYFTKAVAADELLDGLRRIAQRVEYLDAYVLDHPTLASQAPTLLTPRIVQGFRFAIEQLAGHATHQAGMTTAGAAAVGHGDAGSQQAVQQVTGGGDIKAAISGP